MLRDFRKDDFDRLWALDQECFPPGIAYSKAELMHYIRRQGTFTIVAEADGEIAAFVVGEMVCQRGHLITLDVHERVRRAGLGSKLMVAAETRLRERGCAVVFLETAVDNFAAISFYKRHEYAVLKTIPRYYDGKLDALLMGKKLVAGSAESRSSQA
jgi:[ribosomal protein S18]-alanine N-acetyltransferase